MHSPKLTVWCASSSNKVYGPYFIDDADTGNVRTVTNAAYIEMLDNVMTVYIYLDFWFQQDGASSHTSLHARDWLIDRFGNNINSHRSDLRSQAMSLDLSPLDYFLWEYVKERVFRAKPDTINALKQVI